jgi:hypothetical protein
LAELADKELSMHGEVEATLFTELAVAVKVEARKALVERMLVQEVERTQQVVLALMQ